MFTQLNGPTCIQRSPFYLNHAIRPRDEGSFQTRRRTSLTGPEVIHPSWQFSHLSHSKKKKKNCDRSAVGDSTLEAEPRQPRNSSFFDWPWRVKLLIAVEEPSEGGLAVEEEAACVRSSSTRRSDSHTTFAHSTPAKTCRPRRKCERCWTSSWAPGETVS